MIRHLSIGLVVLTSCSSPTPAEIVERGDATNTELDTGVAADSNVADSNAADSNVADSQASDAADALRGPDGGCGERQRLVYPKPGCDGSVMPICADQTDTACAFIACGCDGKVHWYDCEGAGAPYAARWNMPSAEGAPCSGADASPSD